MTIAEKTRGVEIANLAFSLAARPDLPSERPDQRSICFELDDQALARKLEAARGYVEMNGEVTAALKAWGPEAFRNEHLRFVDAHDQLQPAEPPYYERFGEQRVASRVYDRVIRYHTHLKPLADALQQHAAQWVG